MRGQEKPPSRQKISHELVAVISSRVHGYFFGRILSGFPHHGSDISAIISEKKVFQQHNQDKI